MSSKFFFVILWIAMGIALVLFTSHQVQSNALEQKVELHMKQLSDDAPNQEIREGYWQQNLLALFYAGWLGLGFGYFGAAAIDRFRK